MNSVPSAPPSPGPSGTSPIHHPPPTARVLRAASEDAPQVAALWREAIPGAWSFASIETLLNDSKAAVWMALGEHGQHLGFLAGRGVADRFEILAVAVSPAHRRNGHGASLLARAVAEARSRGCRFVDLEVAAGNRAALAFYQGLGFVAVGLRPRYYGSGENALLMSREIADV